MAASGFSRESAIGRSAGRKPREKTHDDLKPRSGDTGSMENLKPMPPLRGSSAMSPSPGTYVPGYVMPPLRG